MNFKEKVLSMKASEIILAMVESLTIPPVIKVNMDTYGYVKRTSYLFGLIKREKCYGCAATNTICQIEGRKFTAENISEPDTRSQFLNVSYAFLSSFENAINSLRKRDIVWYNRYAKEIGMATIDVTDQRIINVIPYLGSDYTNEHLKPYTKLAEAQRELEQKQG